MGAVRRMANEIGGWLTGLGLSKYADVFAANEISLDALPHLTEDDLKELGIPIGPRKSLPRPLPTWRIRRPQGNRASRPITWPARRRRATAANHSVLRPRRLDRIVNCARPRGPARGARRLSRSMLPRHLTIRRLHCQVHGRRDSGYLGYPRAHEDDAERAITNGLSLVAAVRQLDTKATDLSVRVGIATGPVVVGDLIGQGTSQEAAVTSETPNLAARLQALAAPNAVVIAETTYQLAGAMFECTNLGRQSFKGFAEPVQSWSVITARADREPLRRHAIVGDHQADRARRGTGDSAAALAARQGG